MALTESQRLEFYERVKQSSLGKEGADIVMQALPTVDWTDLATHDDLALLQSALRAEMADLRSDLRGEMAELRSEMRGEMAELRSELRGEMTELRGDMVQLRNELRLEMTSLETRLQRSIITWILAAQGVTLATLGLLISVMMIVLA